MTPSSPVPTAKALTPKGLARRSELIDAVLRVLERDGVGAVTHRAVAAEAGVPLAAATYYFASLDELYTEALRRATEHQIALFSDLDATDLQSIAQLIHEWAFVKRAEAIAQYELLLAAMRRQSLQMDAQRWYGALESMLDPDGRDPARARVAAYALDGLMLRMLWSGEPAEVAEIRATLELLIIAPANA